MGVMTPDDPRRRRGAASPNALCACCWTGARVSDWWCWCSASPPTCSGVFVPHVPLEQLPGLWNLPVASYLELTGTPTGLGLAGAGAQATCVNLIGIALLAGCSLPPLLAVIPAVPEAARPALCHICALEVAVIAAGGLRRADVGH